MSTRSAISSPDAPAALNLRLNSIDWKLQRPFFVQAQLVDVTNAYWSGFAQQFVVATTTRSWHSIAVATDWAVTSFVGQSPIGAMSNSANEGIRGEHNLVAGASSYRRRGDIADLTVKVLLYILQSSVAVGMLASIGTVNVDRAVRPGILALYTLVCACGCTHLQLERSMVHQASTVMDIEYQMVLDNIAMFRCNPSALPWHVRINDGVVQVNDQAGIAGLGVQWGSSPNFTRGPQASRSITEQWGADAVTNPRIVKKLQDVYREALGLPPEPDPLFFQSVENAQRSSSQLNRGKNRAAQHQVDGNDNDERESIADAERRKEQQSSVESNNPDDGSAGSPAWPEFEIPTGWFHIGRKNNVPCNACYVGNHCDCYVWVTPDGLPDLSRFTLTILAITGTQEKTAANAQLTFTR